MCFEEDFEERSCIFCDSFNVKVIESYEELGIFYTEYSCKECGEEFVEEEEKY